ncbi:hypothetical protein [Nocardioides deserti]|uniref:SAF domain-containing protein n=1 Tax=Nocardioides deserti TaxID=1588644 RepID=A0ABR6U7R2_9ACTN|nr:hypothetical protein [Nocardioides deserti]MBC2960472.1 hypothetical protein [Nocardioides deserti]GGO71284.1 flagellar protein FlgA [Nocardioides deserti]
MATEQASSPPPATRTGTPGWRDPRLWIGVLVVAASVVIGARVVDGADDTVQVWAVVSDLGAGDRVGEEDLVARRVRFADEGLDRYFTVDDALPPDLALVRGVGADELLPRAAVGSADDAGTVSVPLAVDLVPPAVAEGSVVDVYLTGSAGTPDGPVLDDVVVVDVPALDDGFGATGERQLVVAVDEDDAEDFFARLSRVENPVTTVTQVS